MKLYEEIAELERKIFRAKEQASFLKGSLESVDTAIQLKKKKLDEDIVAYNLRAKREQEILDMYDNNIAEWTKKLDKSLTKQLKKIDKEKVEVVVEKSEKDIRKEKLQAKKRLLAEELKKAKEQLDKMKEEKKEELAEIIEEIAPAPHKPEDIPKMEFIEVEPEVIEKEEQLNIIKEVKEIVNDKLEELEPGKVQCPECKMWYTKGGAFAAHYKSHFNGE